MAAPCALILGDNIFYGHDLSRASFKLPPRHGKER